MGGVNLPRDKFGGLYKSYTFVAPSGSFGINYIGGYYEADAADTNLTQLSASATWGGANHSHAAHAFAVLGGAGTASGGAGAVSLVVSGTSITDLGVRTPTDSETILEDITAGALNQYVETSKKWIGEITYELSSAGPTTYALDLNLGWCKYDDLGNRRFKVTDIECVGRASGNDSGFNIEFLHHKDTGWTYSADAFVPGPSAIYDMNTDHDTEINLASGEPFAWKRASLNDVIRGDLSEGFIIRVTTGANNAVRYMNTHIGFEYF